jgi:hypothetical protein
MVDFIYYCSYEQVSDGLGCIDNQVNGGLGCIDTFCIISVMSK